MKAKFRMLLSAITFVAGVALLFAALVLPGRLAAQHNQGANSKHHHYKLIDMGTFGGPQSYVFGDGNGYFRVLNNHGTLTGWADTSRPDPFPDFCLSEDCFVGHAFQWQNGVMTDLGCLPPVPPAGATGLAPTGSWPEWQKMAKSIR